MSSREAIERYCARENIARFTEQLAGSTDEQQIETLHQLLDEEQRRLERLIADPNPASAEPHSDPAAGNDDRTAK